MSGVHRGRRRCGIYGRKSSEEGLQQDFNSLHAQREACEAFIKSQAHEGWLLDPSVYEDGGYSGGSMERPGLQRLLTEVTAGRIQVIVVYKVDRLTRSLADFARIIESLDANHALFVSVTQQFNTTSSMGRLTLNVLLSFAQFEREVTGERIRDKIAASKRKGLWRGGTVPLGYAPKDRTLVPVPEEAKTVRHIFQRYLEIGSVDALALDLKERGIVSKRRASNNDYRRGNRPISRGALYYLLRNPLYIGQIRHKGTCHAGQHPPLLNRNLWNRVQQKLNAGARRLPGTDTVESTAPLRGKLFDSAGHPMTSTYARKRDGRHYRYYVSQAVLKRTFTTDAQVPRISATTIEQLVQDALSGARHTTGDPWWQSVRKVVLRAKEVTIEFARNTDDDQENAAVERLAIAVNFHKCGGQTQILPANGSTQEALPAPNRTLIRALIRAYRWRAQLESGAISSIEAISRHENVNATYVGKLLPLAYLAPDLTEAILDGRQPPLLMVKHIRTLDIPLEWNAQRQVFARFNG
jgi:DNA invertase Pin-like site-specific DNA recombinase